MKSLFIIPLVLLSLVSFPSWGETMDDLVEREGLYYKKFTAVPFTGEVDESLNLGSIKNGIPEGSWESYWENGQLMSKGVYKNEKKDGPWESYHKNGQLRYKGDYKNGKWEGSWVGYNKDGSVKEHWTGTFKNGVKVSD